VDPQLNGNRRRSEEIRQWFNPAAYSMPPSNSTGNAPRNSVDGPGFRNVNIGLFRDFWLPRKMRLQVRVESTNAFNFVNLNQPEGRLNRSNTGAISSAQAMRQMQVGASLSF
jgi:hypothetical protein